MTLGEYRARVARTVGLSATDAGDVALIDGWVNEAIVQFLRDTKVNQLTAAMAVESGVGDYTLDEDILSFSNVWYEPSGGQSALLEPISVSDLVDMRRTESVADATPRYYALSGAHLLMLYPTPAADADLVHIVYTPRPGLMVDDTHQPSDEARGSVPPEYHPVIEAYVKWKAAEAEEHKPSNFGLTFQAEYAKGVAEVKADMNRKAGVFKARKVGGKRRPRRYPITPGTDLR